MGNVVSDYESEFTKWMRETMQKNPQWREGQIEGRALWWDKLQDPKVQVQYAQAKVAQKAYPYDVNFFPD